MKSQQCTIDGAESNSVFVLLNVAADRPILVLSNVAVQSSERSSLAHEALIRNPLALEQPRVAGKMVNWE